MSTKYLCACLKRYHANLSLKQGHKQCSDLAKVSLLQPIQQSDLNVGQVTCVSGTDTEMTVCEEMPNLLTIRIQMTCAGNKLNKR